MNKIEQLKCDICGRVITIDDLSTGKARHSMVTPDSDLTNEEWETLCAKCLEKESK